MTRKSWGVRLVTASLLALGLPTNAGADVVSSFPSDAQGWQVTQDGQTYSAAPWGAGPAGVPQHSGFLVFTDAGDSITQEPFLIGFFRGGTGWSGDLSSSYGGTLSYSLSYPGGQPDCSFICPTPVLRIYSPNGTVEKDWGQNAWVQSNIWLTNSVGLVGNDPNGLVYPDSSQTPPSPAHLANILSDVSAVEITAEVNYNGGTGDVMRLDDASITGGGTAPAPESVTRTLTLSFKRSQGGFTGTLFGAGYQACTEDQKVTVRRKRRGRDPKVGSGQTDGSGDYLVEAARSPGKYYATVSQTTPPFFVCKPAKSPAVTVD